MQWTMSDKLYEALKTMRIRGQCRRSPRRSANLWLDKVKPKLCEVESTFEGSIRLSTSKRQYGVEMEGNPEFYFVWMKSDLQKPLANGI